ncbi:MAG TPA: alpha/beta fold hydrolase [Vicinamibacterales bacterium]
MHPRPTFAGLALAATLGGAACGQPVAPNFTDRLHSCTADEGPTDAYCGGLEVHENRASAAGKVIRLNIVVLPSIGADVRPDPLVFLAGGPGQGAAQMAPLIEAAFRSIQRTRDIVLVDQRGTGKSNPLNCKNDSESLRELAESDDLALEKLKRCLATLPGDPRLYTTTIAMDDLDDVRAYLGYDQVNLYGGSYGTRAAIVYLKRHPEHVRAVVLDGVAPTDMSLPLFAARDAQRSLDMLLADCNGDAACREAYPGLGERVQRLFARLEAERPHQRLVHPRTGIAEDVEVRASMVAGMLFGALYSPLTSSVLPSLLQRAEQNDFQGLLALAFMAEGATDNMSLGMQLSVLCSEDSPRYSSGDLQREATGTVFGAGLMMGQARACEFWPKGVVEPSYYEPVRSDTPTLVLSGDLDPVTPPSWGLAVTRHLTRVRHYTMPATGHGVMVTACGNRLITQFIEQGSVEGLEDQCIASVKRPGFFLTPAGPEPAPAARARP